jgi:hypothetical protein
VTEKKPTTESAANLPPPKVCKRPGCTRLTRSKTGYCELHKSDANTRKPPLSEEELKERRADDRYEVHYDETDAVACRICGKRMERLGPKGRDRGHLLRDHELSVPQYHQHCVSRGWGTPPTTSLRNQGAIAKWRRDHPEKIKALQIRKNAKDKVRRRTDPQFTKHEGDLIRKRAQAKLTENDKKVRVQCEVPDPISALPCGEWYRGLGKHLFSVHDMSVAEYNILHPGAPTQAPDLVGQESNVGQFNKNWWAEQKRKLADADRVLATRGGGKEKDIRDRTYFEIGVKVEKERPTFKSIYALPRQTRTRANLLKKGFSQPHIDAAIASNNELIAARRFIASSTTTKPPVLSLPHRC